MASAAPHELSPFCNKPDTNTSLCIYSIKLVRMTKTTDRMAGTRKLFLKGLLMGLMGLGQVQGLHADNSATNSTPQTSAAQNPATVDALMDLFVKKGFVSQEEVDQVKAEAEASQTNAVSQSSLSKWKVGDGIVQMEFYGDIRLRYEDRYAKDPEGDRIDLQRERYSVRLGLRGTLLDDFYYGFRLETGSNPRSTWLTMGNSSSSTFQGPDSRSTATVTIGQAYMGWRQGTWLDITVGKMPNPLYTTPLVWSGTLEPEGIAEHFKYTVGQADLFATFGQFVYSAFDPNTASAGLLGVGSQGQNVPNIFQMAWEGGLTYHITDKLSAKAAATIYEYFGLQQSTATSGSSTSPYLGDPYIGEGAYTGPGSTYPVNGWSGYGVSSTLPGYGSVGYPNNQVGLDNLLVLEVPFELDYKIDRMVLRLFGDAAYNFEGNQRADEAAAGYAAYLANQTTPATIKGFAPQTSQVKAYMIGLGLGSSNVVYGPMQGMVYGTSSAKNAWEFRTYWQHIEQYSLDPNILDTDFFNGLENMQGICAAFAYGFSANVIGTVRYAYASRIDSTVGTGGSSQDIPQINPVDSYSIFQLDMTVRF